MSHTKLIMSDWPNLYFDSGSMYLQLHRLTVYLLLIQLKLCTCQVRFSVLRDCLPLAEEKFKKVIKENYFTNKKFDGQLNSEQVLPLLY